MIKQPAKVIAETATSYLLETLPKSACPRCEAGNGCGGGILTKAFDNKTYQIEINKDKPLNINELVQVGIQSSILIRASLLLYLLPLISMIIASLVAASLFMNEDIYTVSGALIGISFGAYLGKLISNHYFKDGISDPLLIDDSKDDCWYKAN